MTQTIIKNDNLFNALKTFFYGKLYPIFLGLFSLLFYAMQTPLLAYFFFVILSAFLLVCFRDLTPFIPVPIIFITALSSFDFFTSSLVVVIFLISILVLSLIAHFILYPIKKFVFGKLFIPFCLITVGLLLGGLFSPYMKDYMRGLPSVLSVGPAMLLLYLLYKNYFNPPKDFNYIENLFYILFIIGVSLSFTMLIHEYYASLNIFSRYDMGFGNTNIYACELVMLLPFSWYFICTKRKFLPFVLALILNYLAIYFSHSDAVLVLAIAFLPVFAILGYIKSDDYHKNIFIKAFLIILFILAVCFTILLTKISFDQLIAFCLDKLSSDNGRTELYLYAIELFKKYPIFGTSFGIYEVANFPLLPNPETETYLVYTMSFHSTFFHLLATTGLVGLIAYLIFYIARYKILMNKNTIYNIVAFLSFTLYQIYAMISHEEFQAFPILIISTILLAYIEIFNKEKERFIPLPLLKKNFNYKDI